jgi:predicted amidophosphoribosyltransferase
MCADCRKGRRPFTVARALGIYEYELRDIILLLKFKGKSKIAEELGALSLTKLSSPELIDGIDAIVPVPLYWQRKRKRRFNQAELLAAYISKRLRIPLLNGYLRRIRNTPPQSQVDAKERAKNVRRAFKVREPWWRIVKGLLQITIDRIKGKPVKKWSLSTPTNYLKGKTVLLIDDIFTTGATVSECARTLKKAGAKEVRVFTIARA